MEGTQFGKTEKEADLADGQLVAGQIALGQISAKAVEQLELRHR